MVAATWAMVAESFERTSHMAGNDVVETVYGKRYKYEIVRQVGGGMFGGTVFWIYRDGSRWKGHYDSLSKAVEVARDAA